MQALDDMTLLREYAARNSEAAFETLVSRRIGFVYSAALRQVRDPLMAGEITQAVFIILAQKAGRISEKAVLTGWFFRTTRFAALAQMRADAKRRRRELEVQMQSEFQSPAADEIWNQMSPLLDEALATLGEKDRQAVLLRFFENKSLAEVGNVLGTGEDTARKRVARALEKLHRHFKKRGVSSTTAIIAGEISANSVQAAPVALAKSVTAVAIAKGAAASGSTLSLIKGALKIMAWTKTKTAIVVSVGVLLATGTATVVVKKVTHQSEPSWANDPRVWQGNLMVLRKLPEVILLRPTKFTNEPPGTVAGFGVTIDGCIKDARKNVDIRELINLAYGIYPRDMARSLFPKDLPREHFDFLFTMPRDVNEVLRNELKTRFGVIAHRENLDADALLLRLADLKTWERHINQTKNQYTKTRAALERSMGPLPKSTIDDKISGLEELMEKPVVNQTGLIEHYDLYFEWNTASGKTEKENIQQALLDQLGLELVPTNMPIEMLVVEKAQ